MSSYLFPIHFFPSTFALRLNEHHHLQIKGGSVKSSVLWIPCCNKFMFVVWLQIPAGTHPPAPPLPVSHHHSVVFQPVIRSNLWGPQVWPPYFCTGFSVYIPRCSPRSSRAGCVPGRGTEVPSQHSAVDDLDSRFHLVLPRPFLPLCLGDPVRVWAAE